MSVCWNRSALIKRILKAWTLIVEKDSKAHFVKSVCFIVLSWSLFVLLLRLSIWPIHTNGTQLNCDLKKAFIRIRLFKTVTYGLTLASSYIFLLVFCISAMRVHSTLTCYRILFRVTFHRYYFYQFHCLFFIHFDL